ncbi:efflux RND transporter periplasmic adaptor subunit [Thiohalorhabdus sp.]|uniref:efflux RND transporter periplasmic adaptor subunit n=1 Tax=Thiohalorhabdus sp. TaxID=3094134 RepID=UPI002FC3C4B4
MSGKGILIAVYLLAVPALINAQGEKAATVEGRFQPRKVVNVGAQVSGPVAKVLVEEGASVSEGDLLARIDPNQYRARLEEAQARAEKARSQAEDSARQLERQQKIYDRGLSATRDLEVAERNAASDGAEVEAAEAAVQSAKVDLRYTRVRAPLDGVVIKRNVEPGETVIANLEPPRLFRVASSLDQLDLVLRLPEDRLDQVTEGDQLTVEVPGLDGHRAEGEVVRVARVPEDGADEPLYPVRVRVANPKGELRPGMAGRVILD